MRRWLSVAAIIVCSSITVSAQGNTRTTSRWALVIGNGQYTDDILHLTNPPNDADAIATALEHLGFQVIHRDNLTKPQTEQAIREWAGNIQRGGTSLFYYAGHAIQLNGNNYLVPIEASFTTPADVVRQSVQIDSIFDALQAARTTPNIIILDACRNNPFVRRFDRNDWVSGLAPPKSAPPNTLIAYATDPGNVADDGLGKHSPYTRALLKYIGVPGMTVEDLFKNVRTFVEDSTDGDQIPWENTSLRTPFLFREPVFIHVQILDGDDDVFVFLNGVDVMSWDNDGTTDRQLVLKAGANELTVKVYNQRTFTGGIEGLGGHLPEGWRYSMRFTTEQNAELLALSAREDVPAKDGPHHGRLFTVANAVVSVDDTGLVTVNSIDSDVWKRQH